MHSNTQTSLDIQELHQSVTPTAALWIHLDKVSKCLLADRAAEAAVHSMHADVIFQEFQLFEGFRAQNAGIGAALCVCQQMVL